MFEEFVGRKIVLLYKDNEKTFVLKGKLLKVSEGFLTIDDRLQGETVISQDSLVRMTLWEEEDET